MHFDGGVTFNNLSGTENSTALTISYSSSDSVQLDGFFLHNPTVTFTNGGQSVSVYQLNVDYGSQSSETDAVVQVGSSIILEEGATFGTSFAARADEHVTDIGTGSSNIFNLSGITGNVIISTPNAIGSATGGDPINDTLINIQNVIGSQGNDTVTGDHISFTAQDNTSSIVYGNAGKSSRIKDAYKSGAIAALKKRKKAADDN